MFTINKYFSSERKYTNLCVILFIARKLKEKVQLMSNECRNEEAIEKKEGI